MDRPCQIMVVDDEPVVCERLEATLKREGHEVTVFVDPAKALKQLEAQSFDIAICDIRMGEIDGMQVLETISRASPRTKVIMITGYATMELARESLTKGAFDFIAKPFKLGEIRATLEKAIATLSTTDQASAGPAGG